MWWQNATTLEIAGRLFVVAFFLHTGLEHLTVRQESHLRLAATMKVPWPRLLMILGSSLNVACCVLLLIGWQEIWGASGLLIFHVLATGIYLRFWTVSDPARRNALRNAFADNVAIFGALLFILNSVLGKA